MCTQLFSLSRNRFSQRAAYRSEIVGIVQRAVEWGKSFQGRSIMHNHFASEYLQLPFIKRHEKHLRRQNSSHFNSVHGE